MIKLSGNKLPWEKQKLIIMLIILMKNIKKILNDKEKYIYILKQIL